MKNVVNSQVHILIVEDSATQAYRLRHLLLQHFAKVTIAGDGTEALPMILADPPTLIVSDVLMPQMDGYELTRRVKADPKTAQIPVILITRLVEPSDVVRGLECGASGFLTKPYEENHLLSRIQFILANLDLRRSARPAHPEAGVEIFIGGQKYFVASEREQILDFLLSTYEVALQKNRELYAATSKLEAQANELERSNAELLQFASIASHDLQEPLRMVASYLGLLQRRATDKLDEKEKQYLHYAVDGAQRMQQMISDLLAYSRVSTHGREFAQADLAEVLRHALANLEVAIAEKGARIATDAMPAASVDASQFVQIFQNLIGNAVKFTSERTPEVHIGCERVADEWQFSVRDNGIGIEAADFERIFQLFQRLHSRSDYPGTGIGLAVCKKIVERHGGRIWLESKPGEGTTFLFTIPAVPE